MPCTDLPPNWTDLPPNGLTQLLFVAERRTTHRWKACLLADTKSSRSTVSERQGQRKRYSNPARSYIHSNYRPRPPYSSMRAWIGVVCKISVLDAVLRHFYQFPSFPTFEIAFFEKQKSRSHSIFLPLYVEHCFWFEWLEFCDHRIPFFGSLVARVANDWRYRRNQIFQALLPFFFLACFLIFLKKAFSESLGKIALEKFPKKNEGTLPITVHDQSMTNATFETVGQVRKAIFACFTTDKKKRLYLAFLALLYFLHAILMAKIAYHCLKKYQGVTSLSLRRILNQSLLFLSTMLGPQTCFIFVCELVSIRLSDCKWWDSSPAKLKPVKD